MRSVLPKVARELAVDERTLRRAVERGTLRCVRSGPRKLELDRVEIDYLRTHWTLVSALTRALRTEPSVRLAVLYGSTARGDERRDSDIDMLVSLDDDRRSRSTVNLAERLARAGGRDVDLVRIGRVRECAPLLILQALDEGRVLVDRDGLWPKLLSRRYAIAQAARRGHERLRAQAAESLRELALPAR